MNDEQLQKAADLTGLAAMCAVTFHNTLRTAGMSRRAALRLTEAWVRSSSSSVEVTMDPGTILHGVN